MDLVLGNKFTTTMKFFLLIFLQQLWTSSGIPTLTTCGQDGWSCNNHGGEIEASFHCKSLKTNESMWLWLKDQFPKIITSVSVMDCNYLSVDLDCGRDGSYTTIRKFHAKNINIIVFVAIPASNPGHFPPELELTNVSEVSWMTDMFGKPHGSCYYNGPPIQNLVLNNVKMGPDQMELFRNLTLKNFILNNVQLDWTVKAQWVINASELISISNSKIEMLSKGSLQIRLQSDKVRFEGNSIIKIKEGSITVHAHEFDFKMNNVTYFDTNGMAVLARRVNFSSNRWDQVEKDAFSQIQPGERVEAVGSFKKSVGYIYEFKNNSILTMATNSLHPDYDAFQGIGSKILVESNSINCTCVKLFGDLDQFFKQMVSMESNRCINAPQCSLLQIFSRLNETTCDDEVLKSVLCQNILATNLTPIDDKETTISGTLLILIGTGVVISMIGFIAFAVIYVKKSFDKRLTTVLELKNRIWDKGGELD